MSYSRWITSSWYTFWDSSTSGEGFEEQALAVWYDMDHVRSWTVSEIQVLFRNDLEYVNRLLQLKYDCSPDEASEAMEYMQLFISDMKKRFA